MRNLAEHGTGSTGELLFDTESVRRGPTAADFFVRAWALVLPMTSILLVPAIQGTTPAYLLTLALLLPWVAAVAMGEQASRFYAALALALLLVLGFSAAGQLAMAITDPLDPLSFFRLPLMDRIDGSLLLRDSMFTQSLYLLAGIVILLFVKLAWRPDWDRWLLGGALLLACYGLYEVLFFLATGQNGDFLTNRTFGADRTFSGSLFQTVRIGPVELPRLKSLTGEPSMYAFTILPFWIYALHTGRRKTQAVLLATLLLSTSTTAVVGLGCYAVLRVLLRAGRDPLLIVGAVAVLLVLALWAGGSQQIDDVYNAVIGDKLAARNDSGMQRLGNSMAVLAAWSELPWINQWLGIGFGVVRSTDLFSTLLINVGVLGLLAFLVLLLWPVVRLGTSDREVGLRLALATLCVTAMVSVPEIAYLSMWLFLGLAYQTVAAAQRAPVFSDTVPGAQTAKEASP
jgi:hypothetical protein